MKLVLKLLIGLVLWLGVGCVYPMSVGGDEPARALFISLIQDPPVLSSRQDMTKLVNYAKKAGIKILFVQIYRANEAWFPSNFADTGAYEQSVKKVMEDPLALLIRQAHREGIEVHAWLNLLSLAQNEKAPILKKYGTDILTQNLKPKRKIQDYRIDSQYFLEPGDPRVRKDLAAIVKEILRGYPDLDGIQYDYIRYPDTNPHYGYTKVNMERFKKSTGLKKIDEESLVWKNWRRTQVTELLTELVKTARSVRPGIKVSATGCMPYVRAYEEAYQDWPSWVSSDLVDFVTIMSYAPEFKEFERTVAVAKTKTTKPSRIKIGVGAYKFIHSPEVFKQQWASCEGMGASCAVFHYGNLLENAELGAFLIRREK